MKLEKVADYLDDYLDIHAFRDDAANGLQVGNNTGNVKKIGLAVDGCLDAIVKAGEAKCSLLIVHHGLYWGKQELILDVHYQRIRALVMADMALYAAHLCLDGHPEVGHNIQIAKKIGLTGIELFANYNGKPFGIKGNLKTAQSCDEIASYLEKAIGCCRGMLKFGPAQIQSIGVISGSATDPDLFKELKVKGIDLFVTGEPKHGAYYLAQEFGLNIFYGGHYMTETFGMRALGEHLEKTLAIPTEFIDVPCVF